MFGWIKNRSKYIVGAWAFFTTAATLILGISSYRDSAALDRLAGREKLDSFMADIRNEYRLRCIEESERLRPIWQSRFDALVDVAKVDISKPPYGSPCRKYYAPNAAILSSVSISGSSSYSAAVFTDLKTFIAMKEKKAIIWVGAVPVEINISDVNWTPLEENYEELLGAIKKCESKEQSKAENAFIKVDCFYSLDKNNNIQLLSIEQRSTEK